MESITGKVSNPEKEEKNISESGLNEVLFKNFPDGVVFRDKKLRYIIANEAFCKLFDIKYPFDFLGKTEGSFYTEENAKLVNEINNTVLKTQEPVSYIMNINAGGKEKILQITSAPIFDSKGFLGIFSLAKDITEEEIIKEKFVSKHFQLKSLLENIPMLIYMQDKNLNYIAGTNPSFIEKGYDAFNNIKVNHSDIKLENEKESFEVMNNNKILVLEKEIEDFKGIPHWYKVYKVPITDYNSNVTGVITLVMNIDSEKQLQSQRETFVASLGHDLKNPTIAQIRSLELLIKGSFGELNSEQKELLEMVLDSCRYMNGMLSALLATYRNNGGGVKLNFAEFSLPELVDECVSEMIYVAKDKNVSFEVKSELKSGSITADRVQIKRVIMNLLSNGIKYAFKNSILKLNLYTEGEKAGFEFENKSPYISEEKRKTIFARYVSYSFSHNETGTGLGLYSSQKIIEAHGGEIYVKSFKDNRNRFGFKLPVSANGIQTKKEVCF